MRISVVTPTLRRSEEVYGLLKNLAEQTHLPYELILVDAAAPDENDTAEVVANLKVSLPFVCRYIRHGGGTAIQRNVGIEEAEGDFIAFIDDDVRLSPDFFAIILTQFDVDTSGAVGGIVGYRTNKHFRLQDMQRWRWYRRLHLLTTYEPGRYDYQTGYPINAYMQPPFVGTRDVDFMTTACAMWRRRVMDEGLRFDHFFRDFGVLEDAHFSLRAGEKWCLLQCGDAHCIELSSPRSRENRRKIGYKGVVNYYYVFRSIVQPLTWRHKARFWRYQGFEILRIITSAARRRNKGDLEDLLGRLDGVLSIIFRQAY